MKVTLVSADAGLCALCREILNDLVECDWQLTVSTPVDCPADADLYIWDSQTQIELPKKQDQSPSKHLYLVHRSEAARFCGDLVSAESTILLKPVTRASLAAFLSFAASSAQRISQGNGLRADRDEILQCLIQSNLKLQEYDQDRTNFLARALHDFRAPLTATSGYCGLLLAEALGPLTEDQKDVLRRMQHSVKRLSRMSSAMFELSIGRMVKRKPDLRGTDIAECIEQALHEINPSADEKRISLSVELDPVAGTLYLEPGQIEQVLVNLLDNACRFTPRAGEIEIRGYPFFWERRSSIHAQPPVAERRSGESRAPNTYRIDIRDSGPLIPWEHLDHIFEEYTSYGGGKDRSGGGLGLAICKMVLTLHDGRVWAENTELGTQFSFVIPVRTAEAARPAQRATEGKKYAEAL